MRPDAFECKFDEVAQTVLQTSGQRLREDQTSTKMETKTTTMKVTRMKAVTRSRASILMEKEQTLDGIQEDNHVIRAGQFIRLRLPHGFAVAEGCLKGQWRCLSCI